MRKARGRERERKRKKRKKKAKLTGSTATHDGVVTEGTPESVSKTICGTPSSRNTATEELAVPRSKPTESGRGRGWSEEEAEAETATARGSRKRRRQMLHRGAPDAAAARGAATRVAALPTGRERVVDILLEERDAEAMEEKERSGDSIRTLLSRFVGRREKNDGDGKRQACDEKENTSSKTQFRFLFSLISSPAMRACLFRQRLVGLLFFSRRISASRSPEARKIDSRAPMTTSAAAAMATASASASASASAAAASPPPLPTKTKKPQPPPPTPTVIHRPPLDPSLLPVPGEPLCRAALRVLNAPTADLKARIGARAARMWFEGQLEPPTPENAGLDPPAPERPTRDDAAVTIVHPQKVKRLKAGGEWLLTCGKEGKVSRGTCGERTRKEKLSF